MKNKEITVLVGLPGSGKTYYAHHNIKKNQRFIDDIKNFDEITKNIDKYDDFMISDPHLCIDKNVELAKEKLKTHFNEIKFIYWENDIEKAWSNVQKRNDGRIIHKSFLKRLSSMYNPPENVKTIKVI